MEKRDTINFKTALAALAKARQSGSPSHREAVTELQTEQLIRMARFDESHFINLVKAFSLPKNEDGELDLEKREEEALLLAHVYAHGIEKWPRVVEGKILSDLLDLAILTPNKKAQQIAEEALLSHVLLLLETNDHPIGTPQRLDNILDVLAQKTKEADEIDNIYSRQAEKIRLKINQLRNPEPEPQCTEEHKSEPATPATEPLVPPSSDELVLLPTVPQSETTQPSDSEAHSQKQPNKLAHILAPTHNNMRLLPVTAHLQKLEALNEEKGELFLTLLDDMAQMDTPQPPKILTKGEHALVAKEIKICAYLACDPDEDTRDKIAHLKKIKTYAQTTDIELSWKQTFDLLEMGLNSQSPPLRKETLSVFETVLTTQKGIAPRLFQTSLLDLFLSCDNETAKSDVLKVLRNYKNRFGPTLQETADEILSPHKKNMAKHRAQKARPFFQAIGLT